MTRLVPSLRRLAGLLAVIAALLAPSVPAIAQAREPAAAVQVIRAERPAPAPAAAPDRAPGRLVPPRRGDGPELQGPRPTRLFLLFRSLLR